MKPKQLIHLMFTALLSLVGTGLIWGIWNTGGMRAADMKLLDLTQQWLPPEPVEDSPMVYIKIGDISDQPWPWPSLDYAILTHSILRFSPKALTMDTPFFSTEDGPTVYDSQFRNQLRRINHSLVSVPLSSTGRHIGSRKSLRPFATVPDEPQTSAYKFGVWPVQEVAEVSRLSPQAFPADADGLVRHVPLLLNYEGKMVASQVLNTYAVFRDADLAGSGAILGQEIILKDKKGNTIESIPINERGEILLRYYPELPLRREVEFYSVILASEQQQQGTTPPFDLGIFRNSLVFLGKEHPNIMEPVSSPHGEISPSKLQLQALTNLLYQSYIKAIPPTLMALAIYLTAAAAIGTAMLRHVAVSLLSLTALVLFQIVLTGMLFYSNDLWIDPSSLILTLLLGWIAGRCWLPYISNAMQPEPTPEN